MLRVYFPLIFSYSFSVDKTEGTPTTTAVVADDTRTEAGAVDATTGTVTAATLADVRATTAAIPTGANSSTDAVDLVFAKMITTKIITHHRIINVPV